MKKFELYVEIKASLSRTKEFESEEEAIQWLLEDSDPFTDPAFKVVDQDWKFYDTFELKNDT